MEKATQKENRGVNKYKSLNICPHPLGRMKKYLTPQDNIK